MQSTVRPVNDNSFQSRTGVGLNGFRFACLKKREDSISSKSADKLEEERKKIEEARSLLQKTEDKKRKRLNQVVDKKIELEKAHSKKQIEEKVKEKFNILNRIELQREYEAKKKLKLLQKNAGNVFQAKVDLIKKLTEIEVKEQINNIALEIHSIPRKVLSYDEVKSIAKQKQQHLIKEKLNEYGYLVNNTFVQSFEEFTKVTKEEERNEMDKILTNHFSPLIEARKNNVIKAYEESKIIAEASISKALDERKREIAEHFEKKVVEDHSQKKKKMTYAKEVLAIPQEELSEILEIEEEPYETDIGVADAEMDKIRVEIYNLENKRRENETNHSKEKQVLLGSVREDKTKVETLRQNCERLQNELKEIKEKEEEFEDIGELALSGMDIKTKENGLLKEQLACSMIIMKREVESTLKEEIKSLQDISEDKNKETEGFERKAKDWISKYDDLLYKLNSRDTVIINLQKTIERLKQDKENYIDFRKDFANKWFSETNRKYAEVVLYEDLETLLRRTLEIFNTEKETISSYCGQEMELLNSIKFDLEKYSDSLSTGIEENIDSVSFLNAFKEDIQTENMIASVYKEQAVKLMEEWKKVSAEKTNNLTKSVGLFNYNQKSSSKTENIIDTLWSESVRSSIMQTNNDSKEIVFVRRKYGNPMDLKDNRQVFKEHRLNRLLKIMISLYQESIVETTFEIEEPKNIDDDDDKYSVGSNDEEPKEEDMTETKSPLNITEKSLPDIDEVIKKLIENLYLNLNIGVDSFSELDVLSKLDILFDYYDLKLVELLKNRLRENHEALMIKYQESDISKYQKSVDRQIKKLDIKRKELLDRTLVFKKKLDVTRLEARLKTTMQNVQRTKAIKALVQETLQRIEKQNTSLSENDLQLGVNYIPIDHPTKSASISEDERKLVETVKERMKKVKIMSPSDIKFKLEL
ncbi:hypothetical protein ABK040_004863 [Willaertia magna]